MFDIELQFDEELQIEDLEIGIEKVYPTLENLTIEPSGEEQSFKSENHYGYDNVKVNPVKLQGKELTLNKNGVYNIVADDNYTGLSGVEVTLDAIEDLEEELNTYNEELTEQETTVEELTELLKTKGIGEPPKYKPRFVSFFGYIGKELNQEISNLDTSNITSMRRMFSTDSSNDWNLKSIDISKFDTSNVTDMSYMFHGRSGLTEIKGLNTLDTSKVTNMGGMFSTCSLGPEQYKNLNTSNVTNASQMFNSFYGELIDVSTLDLSKITSLSSFTNGGKHKEIYLGNQMFNNVTSATYMCGYCPNLTKIDTGGSYVPKMTAIRDAFVNDAKLIDLIFFNDYGKGFTTIKSNNDSNAHLNLSASTLLTYESLMDVINKLYDLNLTYDVANGGTLYTQRVTLGADNIAKLSSDELEIVTAKGWTVS